MPEQAIERVEAPEIGERMERALLPSGLMVQVLPKPGFAKKYATFATHYGGLDSSFQVPGESGRTDVPDGIAHFLEHQLFAEEDGDAMDRFSRLGAGSNAFTTHTSTTYLFSTSEHFEEALGILLDFVQHPYFTEAGVQKERGIILQEIRMYQDDPRWQIDFQLRQALYVRHPFRLDVAGTPDSIRQITRDLLERCYRTFYHPSNMVLTVVGDVDPRRVVDQVAEDQARRGLRAQVPIRRFRPEEPDRIGRKRVEKRMPVARPWVAVGFKERGGAAEGLAAFRRELATSLLLELLFGRGSDFYASAYEEGLIDGSFGSGYNGDEDFGMSVVEGETDEPERLVERVLEAVEETRRRGVDPDRFEALRKKVLGGLVQELDSPESLAYMANEAYFHGHTLFDSFAVARELRLEEVEERLRGHLDPDFHAVSLVLPEGRA
ncbi:MAG: pitrilysin family protein [Bacillota bacterium]|nr:pitrilysin family protein [Bacillota bacterium]